MEHVRTWILTDIVIPINQTNKTVYKEAFALQFLHDTKHIHLKTRKKQCSYQYATVFLKRNEKKNKATAPFSECYSLHAIGLVTTTHPNTYAYWSIEAEMCNISIVLNTIEIQSKLFQLKFVGNTTKHCAMVHLKLKKNRITN